MATRKKAGPTGAAKKKAEKEAQAAADRGRMFSIEAQFAVEDTRTVRDPFVGLLWNVARIGYAPYQAWMRKNQRTSPFFSAMTGAVMQARVLETMKGQRKRKKKPGVSAVDQATLVAKALEKVDWSTLDLQDIAPREGAARHLIHGISHDEESRIEFGIIVFDCTDCENRWDDTSVRQCPECGSTKFQQGVELQEYSPEAGMQLLGSTTPVPSEVVERAFPPEEDEEPPGEMELGQVLYLWLMKEATATEKYRQRFLGEAEGN